LLELHSVQDEPNYKYSDGAVNDTKTAYWSCRVWAPGPYISGSVLIKPIEVTLWDSPIFEGGIKNRRNHAW
jgi:hypothetical protein